MRTDRVSSLGVRSVAGSLLTLTLLAVLTWLVVLQGTIDHVVIAVAVTALVTLAVYINVRATRSSAQGSRGQGSDQP